MIAGPDLAAMCVYDGFTERQADPHSLMAVSHLVGINPSSVKQGVQQIRTDTLSIILYGYGYVSCKLSVPRLKYWH